MKKTVVYIYAMSHDNGFAPCVENEWLTLACCMGAKNGGMRKYAADNFNVGNTVYILALCGKALAGKAKLGEQAVFRPIYLAKIDEVLEMTEYYTKGGRATGRKDDVYQVIDGKLVSKENNPHQSASCQEKDSGGQYVLCSRQFTYWGNKCGESGHEIEQDFPWLFRDRDKHDSGKMGIRDRITFRNYIVEKDFPEFEEKAKTWSWFPKQADCCNIISNYGISEN